MNVEKEKHDPQPNKVVNSGAPEG